MINFGLQLRGEYIAQSESSDSDLSEHSAHSNVQLPQPVLQLPQSVPQHQRQLPVYEEEKKSYELGPLRDISNRNVQSQTPLAHT